ncbi:MAG TPA: ClcB-like voltage-gated chloride channel protein [Candidatus Binatia bacterium]|nr:ClcB-like voltage-gated chloride channel protein [Candidatus Binatia bacterium]
MAERPTIPRLLNGVHEFFRRHWRRALIIRDQLRLSEEAFHLLLAAAIGVIGALTNLAYHTVSQLTKWLVLSRTGDLVEIAEALAPWQRLLVPTLGGLAAGLVLYLGLRLISNPGLSNLLEAVVAGDGRLLLRPALTSAVSSLISINTGASIGREGLLIQLSSTLASKVGQLGDWPPYRLRLMVACGAAAGIAAVYNAPISGAVFAAQIVLGNFSMNLFAPLLVSSVVASVLSRTFFGIGHWFDAPEFEFTRLSQLPWFLLLGVFSGVVGASFLRALEQAENLFGRLQVPLYVRLGLAGLVVGLIALVHPDVWGNGYGAINRLLREEPELKFLLGLFTAKFLATAVTVGSGTVGGAFTPTLFLGAAFGSLFEGLLHEAGWASGLPVGCFAMVGMGSTLAATTHSPLLAMIMLFELSLNYSLMPPLMLACAVSTLVGRRLHPESIYTEPLRRKGLQLDRESPGLGVATQKTVGDLMRQPVPPLRENTSFREMADRFLTSPNNFLPVVDDGGRLLGMVDLHDLKEYLNAGHELSSVIASDVMRPPPVCLTPNQRLSDVLPVLLGSELRNVPVVDSAAQFRLVGTVARAEALGLLSEAISARSASA